MEEVGEQGEHKEALEGTPGKSLPSSHTSLPQQEATGGDAVAEGAAAPTPGEHGSRARRIVMFESKKKPATNDHHGESKVPNALDVTSSVQEQGSVSRASSARSEVPPDENDLIEVPKIGLGVFNSEYNNLREFRKAEVHWNYYDALHRSRPTIAAKEAGTNSLEDENLDKYFKKTLSRSKFNSLDSFMAATASSNPFAHHTPPFDELLPLQCGDGRWIDLPRVLQILQLKSDVRLEKATIWEMASAFVLAKIRQRIELFEELREYHDRAIVHFPTQELIIQAKEIILVNDLTLELKAVMKSRGVVADSDDEDDKEIEGSNRTAEELELEMLANQTWHVAVGGTLDHVNADLAEDPFMQLPDQGEFEKMTAKITEPSGALPTPVMTSLSHLPKDDVLVHWSERPSSRGKRKKSLASENEGEEEKQGLDKKASRNPNRIEEVDEDYVLGDDEEWVTDSDDETYSEEAKDEHSEVGEEEAGDGAMRVEYGPVEEVDGDYSLADDEEWVDSSEDEEEPEPEPEQGEEQELSLQERKKGLSLSSLGISVPGEREHSGSTASSRQGSPVSRASSPAHRSATPSRGALRPGSSHVSTPSGTPAGGRVGSPGYVSFRDRDEVTEIPRRASHGQSLSEGGVGEVVVEGNEGPWDLDSGDLDAAVSSLQVEDQKRNTGHLKRGLEITVADAGEPRQELSTPQKEVGGEDLIEKIRGLTPQKDQAKINRCQRALDQTTVEAVFAVEEIERQVEAIKDCLARAIIDYNAALTEEERNVCFDEITAMLGDDCPPREGFLDWRKDGLPGMRPRCVKFFNLVHKMSLQRLELEELQTPEGRDPSKPQPPGLDRDWTWYDQREVDNADIWRWGFQWNGVDMVLKVMHCLDFLRMHKEIASWYGRSFWFCGNPLMLPFQPYTAYPTLDMDAKVKEQLVTKAHLRPQCSVGGDGFTLVSVAPGSPTWERCGGDITSLNEAQEWKHEKYMLRWRERFDDLCNGVRYPNWPNSPSLKLDEDNDAMYRSMLVCYVRCKKSMYITWKWEKEFISLASTIRGSGLMMGTSGLKPDRSLEREVEQRLIVLKEKAEERRLAEVERKKAAEKAKESNTGLDFLASLSRATLKKPTKRISQEEYQRLLAEERRNETFKRLIAPRKDFGPDDIDGGHDLPFEKWSSLTLHKPGSPNQGFGRSPTRSPPPQPFWYMTEGYTPEDGWTLTPAGNIIGPQGLIRSPEFSSTMPRGLTLSPIRPKLTTCEWDAHGRKIRDNTDVISLMAGVKTEADDSDNDDSQDGEEEAEAKEKKDKKKKDKKKRKKRKKLTGTSTTAKSAATTAVATEGGVLGKEKSFTRQGSNILRHILGDDHRGPISRQVVMSSIANKDNRVSRLRGTDSQITKLTRKANVGQALPPVRRGGGALYTPAPSIAKRPQRQRKIEIPYH